MSSKPAFVIIALAALVACDGRSRESAYQSLRPADQATCHAFAQEAVRFARGRDAGTSLDDHLKAVGVSCVHRPDTCEGFRLVARDVHQHQWSVADAGVRVQENCKRYLEAAPEGAE